MRLGIFSIVDSYSLFHSSGRDRYAELGTLAEAADRAGLSTFWVAEHHFSESGTNPSPPVLLAHLGARTHRIRLGAMVSVLPFHRAVDVAEEYALLDQLIGGRLEFGVGSGYLQPELDAFGVPFDGRRERFDRNLAQIRSAWRGMPIRAADGEVPEVVLNVRPRQRPGPPLWVAAQRREAAPFVARQDANLAVIPYATLDRLEELGPIVGAYRAARPTGDPGRVGAALHVAVESTPGEARPALERYLASRSSSQSRHYLEKLAADPQHGDPDHLDSAELVAIGTEERVGARLERLARLGVDDLLAIVDFGGLELDRVVRTVEALGRRTDRLASVGP